MITFDDFKKIELKVAKILSAEKIEESDKLIKLQVDLGSEQRQLVAGIGLSYSPEDLIGKSVVMITNLEPRMIRGIESQGMLLAAGAMDNPVLLTVDREIASGAEVS
jgi:methionine--tRNA ligase beta chain